MSLGGGIKFKKSCLFQLKLLSLCKINLSDRSWGWWVPKINIVPGSDRYARVIYHDVHDDDDDDDDDVDDNIDDSEVICRGGESPDGGRRRVCRTESVKTQVNLNNQHDRDDRDDSNDDHNNDDNNNDNDDKGYHDHEAMNCQNSLLLLEEKMELLADLQQKAEKCRLNTKNADISMMTLMIMIILLSVNSIKTMNRADDNIKILIGEKNVLILPQAA